MNSVGESIIKTTIPRLVEANSRKFGDKKVALRQKDLGIWVSYSWKAFYENMKFFALGLVSLGLTKGNKICIIGDNDVHWVFAQYGAMAGGGVPIGLFADSLAPEIKDIIERSDSIFAVVEDQEQVDKLLEIVEELPQLKKIIYWDPKGLRNYNHNALISYDDVIGLGKAYEEKHADIFNEIMGEQSSDDVAIMCLTSGTTGAPKMALLTHRGLIESNWYFHQCYPGLESDNYFCADPLPWLGGFFLAMPRALFTGASVNFPEAPETAQENLKEISPRLVPMGARLLEAITREVAAKIESSALIKRLAYKIFMPVGYRMADLLVSGKKPNLLLRALNIFAYFLLFRPLRDSLGMRQTKFILTGGTGISSEFLRFFRALGLPALPGYGSSETAASWIFPQENDIDYETSGIPFPYTEVRIMDNSEILIRGIGLMKEYYKDPVASAEKIRRGWLYSGDGGFINDEYKLMVLGRLSELSTLENGTSFSPMYLENKLKFSPYIRDAMVIGRGRSYVTALISIDYGLTGKWAEARSIPYTTYIDLSQKPEVINLIAKHVLQANQKLPRETKIRKMVLLTKELDADDAELTRTRKLRRGYMEQQYKEVIDALYSGAEECLSDIEVKYRGAESRKAVVKTKLKIVDFDEIQKQF